MRQLICIYFFPFQLRKKVKSWKGIRLLDKLISKSENAIYYPTRVKRGVRVANGKRCLIIGAGPCGLRTAIEMAFLGAHVQLIDSRSQRWALGFRVNRNRVTGI